MSIIASYGYQLHLPLLRKWQGRKSRKIEVESTMITNQAVPFYWGKKITELVLGIARMMLMMAYKVFWRLVTLYMILQKFWSAFSWPCVFYFPWEKLYHPPPINPQSVGMGEIQNGGNQRAWASLSMSSPCISVWTTILTSTRRCLPDLCFPWYLRESPMYSSAALTSLYFLSQIFSPTLFLGK